MVHRLSLLSTNRRKSTGSVLNERIRSFLSGDLPFDELSKEDKEKASQLVLLQAEHSPGRRLVLAALSTQDSLYGTDPEFPGRLVEFHRDGRKSPLPDSGEDL